MSPRALVVDDDKMMVRTLSDVLRLSGWEVTTAYSGAAAVRVVSREPFDVVLMDVKMPGMDGVTAFKAMKAARPSVRVILMTAYAAQEAIAEAEREGVVRVMSKPVDLQQLLALITAQLGRRRPVLLIDHDASFLRTLSEVLALTGIETVLAATLNQATQMMAAEHPAAVLLHLHITAADAHETVAAVHRASPDTALILYSGLHAAEELEQAIPSGWVHAYLQKPFAIGDINRILNAL